MIISNNDIIVFAGDSITDCNRRRYDHVHGHRSASCPMCLGDGYVQMIGAELDKRPALKGIKLVNRGVSGDRIYDLEARMEVDLCGLNPTIVSVLIGVNDTLRVFDNDLPSTPEQFLASYKRILTRIQNRCQARIVIMEPFFAPSTAPQIKWLEDLNARIMVIRTLADDCADVYVPLNQLFAATFKKMPASELLPDGVHPSEVGHRLIAGSWLKAVGFVS